MKKFAFLVQPRTFPLWPPKVQQVVEAAAPEISVQAITVSHHSDPWIVFIHTEAEVGEQARVAIQMAIDEAGDDDLTPPEQFLDRR